MGERKIKGRNKELNILHHVARVISSRMSFDEILHHVLEIADDLTEADSVLIYIYDKENNELVLKASKNPHPAQLGRIKLKMGEGITGWVAQNKKPAAIESRAFDDPRFKKFTDLPEDTYEAFLSVPILSEDEVVGVINIQHKSEHKYPNTETRLLFTAAKYLGSAVRNAFVKEEIQKKQEQLEILSKISRTIISDNYLQEILHLIVTMTAEVMNSKICSIMLVDKKNQELVIAATQSLSDEYKNKPNLKIGQSISGKVVNEKRAITVSDVTKEKGYMYPEMAKKEGIVSMLAVPMMVKEDVIGVINSYTDEIHNFTKEEASILQSIANQAAAAIENTRLSNEILKAKEELETRKIIEKAKGLLMKDFGITEDEAYRRIRKKSMDARKTMKEVAEAVLLASEMENK